MARRIVANKADEQQRGGGETKGANSMGTEGDFEGEETNAREGGDGEEGDSFHG